MTHAPDGGHPAAPAHSAPGSRPFFGDEEWQWFVSQDCFGAKMIVGLMASIFMIGFLLYATIAILVKS
jgi:hypothetical protein